jgi:hypothetical protein
VSVVGVVAEIDVQFSSHIVPNACAAPGAMSITAAAAAERSAIRIEEDPA